MNTLYVILKNAFVYRYGKGDITMGLFEHFPYTNFHELNLDWWIDAMKKLEARVEALEKRIEQLKQEILEEVDRKLAEFKEQLLQEVQEKLDALKEELTTLIDTKISEALAPIIQRIEKLENDLEQLRNDFDECCAEVRAKLSEIETEIGIINGRLDSIDTDISNITTEITTIKERISTIENRLDNDEQAIDDILSSIDSINTSIGSINNTIHTIQTNINSLGDRVSAIETDLRGIHVNIASLGDRVSTVENNVGNLTTIVNQHTTELSDHEDRIQALENNSGGSGSASAGIYVGTASNSTELIAIRSAVKKSKYAGVYIKLTADSLMRKDYDDISNYVSNEDLVKITSVSIVGVYNRNGVTNALDFRRGYSISHSYFEYIKILPHSNYIFVGVHFKDCKIEVSSNDDDIIFQNCVFDRCEIQITTASIAYDRGVEFNACQIHDTKITATSLKQINRIINCSVSGSEDRYSSKSYGSIITNFFVDGACAQYSVFDNCMCAPVSFLVKNTLRNNTTAECLTTGTNLLLETGATKRVAIFQ